MPLSVDHPHGGDTKLALSEDWAFCHYASKLGIPSHVASRPLIRHYGMYGYGVIEDAMADSTPRRKISLLHASRPTDDERAAGAKASNYLANLLAVHEAKQQGAQEALMLGRHGQILEGASSNVFIVQDGALRTPEPQPGILVGITRAAVLAAASAEGIVVQEAEVRPEDLYGADEAFITSSIREVMPVVSADGRTIGSGAPGSVTKRLHQGYLKAVADATGAGV